MTTMFIKYEPACETCDKEQANIACTSWSQMPEWKQIKATKNKCLGSHQIKIEKWRGGLINEIKNK